MKSSASMASGVKLLLFHQLARAAATVRPLEMSCSSWALSMGSMGLPTALARTNQVLSACGKPVLPIESQTVEQLVTAGITTVAALVAWWKNNSFTVAALQADQTYDKLKAQGK